ncbi:MAG TPA: acyl carrier protein [Ktedonobacterales bacterium]
MDNALEERIREIIASTFNLDPEDVGSDASAQTLRAWTSLAQLRLLANIQETFGIHLSMDDMLNMTSVQAIEHVLAAKGVVA